MAWDALSPAALEDRFGVPAGLIRDSSTATWEAYSRARKEFFFCWRRGWVDVAFLVLYFGSRNFGRGVLASAVDRKLVGLAFCFKLLGVQDCTKAFSVRQVMERVSEGSPNDRFMASSVLFCSRCYLRTVTQGLFVLL